MTNPEQNALFSDSVIREMFRGDVSPDGSAVFDTPKWQERKARMDTLTDNFAATLTDEQKILFEEWADARLDERSLRESEVFLYAFKLGGRLMNEILSKPHHT